MQSLMSHSNIDMIAQYGESKNKNNCQKFQKLYFAGRILLALINVLTHSAVGGEPVTQRTRTLKTAWGVHTTANTPPRFLALINICATPSIGLQLVTRAAVASVRSPKVCALLCAHVWNLCTFVDI